MDSIDLKSYYPFLKGGKLVSYALPYIWDDPRLTMKRPGILVIPGGGYQMVSKREAGPIAAAFAAQGFQAFVLEYLVSTDGVSYPEELHEIACACDYVKKHAEEFHVNPNEVFAVGFSAGGHLVGLLANEQQRVSKELGLDCTLRGAGLIYPVISSSMPTALSFENLFKGYEGEALEKGFQDTSLELHVTKDNPPAFVCCTENDEIVNCRHSLKYVNACVDAGVTAEFHLYSKGPHGLSDGSRELNFWHPEEKIEQRFAHWIPDCAAFFFEFCEEKR